MLIPQVRQATYTGDTLTLPLTMRLQAEAAVLANACQCASLLLEATVMPGEDPHILAVQTDLPAEGYRLTVGDAVRVEYADYRGLCHALATVSGLLTACDGGYTLPRGHIEDAPTAAHRGVMLDVARGIKPIDELKEDMAYLARARMNILHLHLFDSVGCAVALDCLPTECILQKHYTKEEVAQIVQLAEVLGLEIIPEFDLPAHSKKLTAVIPETACAIEGHNSGWVTCAGSEKTFEIYEAIIDEIVTLFPGGRYFHIGGDELEMADEPRLDDFCHWDDCPRCQRRMAQEGLRDRQELYYYVMGRVHKMVKQRRRQTVMWSDQIDCTRPCPLPQDIVMHFWRIAGRGRGPVDGCSFDAQLSMGYKAINSHYLEAYIEAEGEMSEDTIRDWRWDRRPSCDETRRQQILGGELCAWNYGVQEDPRWAPDEFVYINRGLAPGAMLMGDKLWNGEDFVCDDRFRQKLTRAVLGPHTPKGLDIWKAFGSIMPPKSNTQLAYYDKITCTDEELRAVLEALRGMPATRRVTLHADAVEAILKQRKEA